MKKTVTIFMFLILILLGIAPEGVNAAGAEYFADPTGSGSACTLASPCSLQAAVDKAIPSDHVYLRSGTYTSALPTDDFVLNIKGDLWLLGGCTWTSLADFSCNENNPASILDGEGVRRVIRIEGATADVSLSRITIQEGNATSIETGHCTTWGGSPASGCGGGIFATDVENLTINDINFIGNVASMDSSGTKASFGGGLYADDVEYLNITFSEFEHNRAGVSGSGYGGAIYIENSGTGSEVDIHDSLFQNNNASTGLKSKGAALMMNQPGRVLIYENSFIQNNFDDGTDMEGSVVYFSDLTTAAYNFSQNSVTNNAGKSLLHSSSPSAMWWNEISSNRFWSNKCETNIYLEGVFYTHIRHNFLATDPSSAPARVGVQNIYTIGTAATNATVNIFLNSIVGAPAGINIGEDVNAYVKGNIIAYNAVGIPKPGDSGYSDIDSNLFFGNTNDGTVGTNPYYGNPKFVNMTEGDLHLRKDSAAIDRLATGFGYTEDIDGYSSRPFGIGATPYDIGADEWDMINEVFLPILLR